MTNTVKTIYMWKNTERGQYLTRQITAEYQLPEVKVYIEKYAKIVDFIVFDFHSVEKLGEDFIKKFFGTIINEKGPHWFNRNIKIQNAGEYKDLIEDTLNISYLNIPYIFKNVQESYEEYEDKDNMSLEDLKCCGNCKYSEENHLMYCTFINLDTDHYSSCDDWKWDGLKFSERSK